MTLSAFLELLAADHTMRGRFIDEPHILCDECGVSAEDQLALRTNSQAAIDKVMASGSAKKLWVVNAKWVVKTGGM